MGETVSLISNKAKKKFSHYFFFMPCLRAIMIIVSSAVWSYWLVGGVHFNGRQACSLKNCTVRSAFKGNACCLAADYR